MATGANMNDTMKVANLENPHFGTGIWDISPIQAEFCGQIPKFLSKEKFTKSRSPIL